MLNRLFSVLLVLPMLLTGSLVPGQESSKPPAPLKVAYSKNLKCYYGVMGHVERQGVFEFMAPCANLAELIERTGGLKKSATGNLKIVHPDGSESQAFYSAHSQQKLLPNDILVIEGIDDKSRRKEQVNRSEKRTRIGLINLVGRPVILKIRDNLVTLDRLLEYLNQPPELAKSLRIVRPAGYPSGKIEEAKSLLTEGSIIVFAPGSVKEKVLPFHAEFEPVGVVQDSTINTQPQNGTAAASAKEGTSKAKLSRSGVKNNDLQPASRKGDHSRLTSLPPNWANETSADNRDNNEPNTESAANILDNEGNREDSSFSSVTDSRLEKVEPVEAIFSRKQSSTAWKQKLSSPMFVTVICILGSVILFSCYLLWSISRKTRSIERSQQSKSKKRNYLKELIEDSIPVVALDVPHPGNFMLFDTPSREKFLRIDAAHQIRRPQFLPRESQPKEKKVDETSETTLQYDTILHPEETVTVEPETGEISNASEKDSHEVRAPHFLNKKHTPLAFQPHSQHNDYIQRVLQRVRQEERK